jgi:hypothetical protein
MKLKGVDSLIKAVDFCNCAVAANPAFAAPINPDDVHVIDGDRIKGAGALLSRLAEFLSMPWEARSVT